MPLEHGQTLPLLELDVLRSFVAIAETGSFTAAASRVHRTPSAISMQIKKLEEQLGRPLFLRESRSVSLTSDGELLIGYARRMLALNREAVSKFVVPEVSGIVRLGAPDDVAVSVLPDILRRFAQTHPDVVVDVTIDQTVNLKRRMVAGQLDITLLTCMPDVLPAGTELMRVEPLVWVGARGGQAHLSTPLPVSMWEEGCIWRALAVTALEAAELEYRVSYMSAHTAGQRSAIASDLAVAVMPASFPNEDFCILGSDAGLPELGECALALQVRDNPDAAIRAAADHVRAAYERMPAAQQAAATPRVA